MKSFEPFTETTEKNKYVETIRECAEKLTHYTDYVGEKAKRVSELREQLI